MAKRTLASIALIYLFSQTGALGQTWQDVPDARQAPHKFVGKIVTFWPDGSLGFGTGALIGPRHVLTAAHVVRHGNVDAAVVMFTPGEQNGRAPFGSSNASYWAASIQFLEGSDSFSDFAVIRLNDILSDRTGGYFTLNDWTPGWAYDCTINGYPGIDAIRQQRINSRLVNVPDYHPLLFTSANRTPGAGGASGGPAWFYQNGRYRLVGIFTGWSARPPLRGIYGVKLTTSVRMRITDWIRRNP